MRNLDQLNSINANYTHDKLEHALSAEKQIGDFLKNKIEKRRVSPQIIKKIKNKIKVQPF